MKLPPPTRSALATIGGYYVLTSDKATMHPRLRRSGDRFVCPEMPEGLSPDEAFGLTLAVRWAEIDAQAAEMQSRILDKACPTDERTRLQNAIAGRRPLVTRDGDAWLVALPGEEPRLLPTDRAVVVTRALFEVCRVLLRGPRAFAPRDPQAELLQLQLRSMEAELRGPTPVVIIHPELIESDLGRNWSSGYECRG